MTDGTSAATANGARPLSPGREPLRHGFLSPHKSVAARPALRLCSVAAAAEPAGAAGNSFALSSPVPRGSSATIKYPVEQRQRPWSPLTSPAMSKMKREGFAVHDAAATVGGGFYLERPLLSWGRLWECGTSGGGVEAGESSQCRQYSAVGEFSTAPMPPRFASFVVGGIPQVGYVDKHFAVLARTIEKRRRLCFETIENRTRKRVPAGLAIGGLLTIDSPERV